MHASSVQASFMLFDRYWYWMRPLKCYISTFADKHNSNHQTITVLWAVSTKGECTNWTRADSTTGQPSTSTHNLRWQWFCQQLLLGAILCKITPICTSKLCCIPYFRVSQNSCGIAILYFFFCCCYMLYYYY